MKPPEIGGWQDHSGELHEGAPEPGDEPYGVRVWSADHDDAGGRWYTILEPFPDWDEPDELIDWIDEWLAANYGELE